ncbi:LuxR C-terminal-related transcriptional regulator [Dyadobacter frigoris]|uniref:Response regulator transcription factor n=1 Tax=Dyadobacter frigoris TaxID=2576211 RepID=A0A4U6CMD1_9BACT|nr:response regulator transcription factor [Dyadobacter frigoris]TKT85502.1 response regulator transcription factor [Dyadobacter frigoris]GLU56220.1 DNA-binding response regulator [Dyadobacter frigoris]
MKIAIIDKFPVLRLGVLMFLKDSFSDVTIIESDTILSFNSDFPFEEVDLIILGISQSARANEINAICQIKKRYPAGRFIGYMEKPESATVISYMNTGISGYLSKHAVVSELMECIQFVLKGRRYISQEIIDLILNSDKDINEERITRPKRSRLTPHEYEIAKYLSEGMRTSWIAEVLNRKASTISTIKSTIFKKMQVDNIMKLRDEIEYVQFNVCDIRNLSSNG